MANEHDDRRDDRQAGEQHPGADGEKVRVPENPDQPRRDQPPIGNGGVNQPAAFPPHH
jgi:hypothetical protein